MPGTKLYFDKHSRNWGRIWLTYAAYTNKVTHFKRAQENRTVLSKLEETTHLPNERMA